MSKIMVNMDDLKEKIMYGQGEENYVCKSQQIEVINKSKKKTLQKFWQNLGKIV